MDQFSRFIKIICFILDKIAAACFFAVMLLIISNILLRTIFGRPILGTYELVGFLSALGIGFALARCSLQNGHIAVDLVTQLFTRRVQHIIELFMNAAALLFWSAAVWFLFEYGQTMKLKGLISPSAEIPLYPFIYIIALGLIGLCLTLVLKLIIHIREIQKLNAMKRAIL